MKHLFLTIIFALPVVFGMAQAPYQVEESNAEDDKISRPCITAKFSPTPKEASEAWKDYMKDKHDVKLKGLRKEDLIGKEVVVNAITPRTIDLTTRFVREKSSELTTMNVFVSFGYDLYLTKADYAKEHNALKNLVKNFTVAFLTEYYADKVKDAENALKKVQKDKEKKIKRVGKLEDNIKSNKEKIEDLKKENEEKTEEIAKTKEEIEELSKVVTEKKAAFDAVQATANQVR